MSRKLSLCAIAAGCESSLRACFALIETVRRCADCCRPALLEVAGTIYARCSYVFETVGQLEKTHPQAMIALTAPVYPVGPDGIARSAGDGSVAWAPRQGSAQLSEAFPGAGHGSPLAAALAIGSVDLLTTFSQPFTAELPAAILEIVAAEPSGPVGISYRRYVKSTLLPGIRRVAAILRSHAATIKWPSVAWQKEKFPGRSRGGPGPCNIFLP